MALKILSETPNLVFLTVKLCMLANRCDND